MPRYQGAFNDSQLPPKNPLKQQQFPTQPIQGVMQELEQLSEKIQNNPQYPLVFLKDYITIYVQNHNRSEEFFNLMCEHNMLAKLFSGVSRPIYILQVFNLLLANTHQSHEIVYIFSHPLFHNYLLINFEVIFISGNAGNNSLANSSFSSGSQCVEYYIQLLKTIVTKLETQSDECTLLKLFCNSKYSSFPLLTNCIILAIKRNVKQQLVRVTAQHCILQLVGIMAKKKLGEYYFSNIHMLIFFYQIIQQTIQQQTTQSSSKDTTIKYIIDLLKAISLSSSAEQKDKSFLLFFTIFNNLVIFRFLRNPAPGLHLLFKLSNCLSEIQQLQEMTAKYLTPVYFNFAKYLFNKYLSNVSLSSIILLTQSTAQLSQLKQVNILKIIKNHYQKSPLAGNQIQEMRNTSYDTQKSKQVTENITQTWRKSRRVIKQTQNSSQKRNQSILKQVQKYNMDNQQFFQLKQNFYRQASTNSGSWFFNFNTLFKKINVFDIATGQYIKKLAHLGAVKYNPQQPIKFPEEIFSSTAVYIYEFLKVRTKEKYFFGQKEEDTQKTEISFNQNRDQFVITRQFFKVILNLAQLVLCEIDSLQQESPRNSLFQFLECRFNKKISHPGQVYFVLHFRQYFQHSLSQFICNCSNYKLRIQLSASLIRYLYKISVLLQPQISQGNKTKIQTQILKIQKQLYEIVKQKGFDFFREYLQSQEQKKMLGETGSSFMNVSMIKFQNKPVSNYPLSKKKSKLQKKKKSIFGSFRKQVQSSPQKNVMTSLKSNEELKVVQCKMMHLQLLRFLLRQSDMFTLKKRYQKQRLPLFGQFQRAFMQRYSQFIGNRTQQKQVIYQAFGLKFNSQNNCECSLRIKADFQDFAIYCELLYKDKLILKCNIKQFTLSQPYSINQQNHVDRQHKSQQKIETNNLKDQKPQYLITQLTTVNTLGFQRRQDAIQFANKINEIKFGFRQVKDSAILKYLNKQDQNQGYQ